MNTVGLVYHPEYLKHDTGAGHPERPQRLETMVKHLLGTPLWKNLLHLQPEPAPIAWIHAVHPETYVSMIRQRCVAGEQVLDSGDTHVCPASYDVALLAAGGVLLGVEHVLSGKAGSVFCAGRPPGHHAETSTVMGFCLFNNVAVGTRYAQKKHGIGRVAIVDWDVHHGNGTQEVFYEDDSVFYISLHQFPLWPGTGAKNERGRGKGEGFTLNCPMEPGSGEKEYLEAFQTEILPALDKFRPELLMISAGFDAHRDDPLANINLSEGSFGTMTKLLREVAERHCDGRIVSVLEGGYHLNALAKSVEVHLSALME
ncbi:MAG: histone deacetylase [Ignavibacteriales bacterium]|nr:histone deacetylase [Ignavibacteriales bacterium]